MNRQVILDTGPLVAAVSRRDRYHSWAKDQLAGVTPPMLTCEAVLAEACYLLRDVPGGSSAVLALVDRGVLRIEFQVTSHVRSLDSLMAKYADIGMSFADACLVRMTELHEGGVVLTLDSDFKVYRRHGRQTIPLFIPAELS